MGKKLNENAILQRMTREDASMVKGGDGGIVTVVDSICQTLPKQHLVCDCLLAGCGCTSQTVCTKCA